MKKGLFLSAIAAVALASCSNEQVVDQPKGDNLIGFSPLTTRGTVVTNAQGLQATTFKVWGFDASNTAYIDGTDVSYSAGSSAWTYNPKKAWPEGALNFFAINPATATGLEKVSFKANAQGFQYTVPATAANQTDIMFAVKKNQTKANGTVGLVFKHALAQVAFKATTTGANFTAQIKSIEVCNTQDIGAFILPVADTETGVPGGRWTLTQGHYGKFTVGTVGNTTVSVTNSTTDVTAADGVLMQLPQDLSNSKWTTKVGTPVPVTTADTDHKCYLKIELKLKDGNTYLVGSDTEFKTVYMPFGFNWEMGKKYIYNLKFGNGAGFDDKGNPILNYIEFNPSVENWIEEKVVDIDM